MFQLIVVENALALEVTSNGELIATSRVKGDPYKVAQRNGWTFQTGKGTKKARRAALLDVISIRAASDPNYTPGEYVKKAVTPEDAERSVSRGRRWLATGVTDEDF